MEVPVPTVHLCECPNGCVNVRIGFVSFHFDRRSFRAFVRRLVQAAAALDEAPQPATEH